MLVPPIPGRGTLVRGFRRMLSGSEQPPGWVRALEQPGDAGWFGPGSAVWQVHGSVTTLVGGVRALLLQSLHPLALAGVLQHSDYRDDALGRLHRTNRFLTTTTYGSSRQAMAAVAAVRRTHERVTGHADDGRPYAAGDPHLLLWVHAGLIDSMLVAYQALSGGRVDADAYVGEMADVAVALGIPDPPRDQRGLTAAIEAMRPELAGGADVREVIRFLARPPLPRPAQPGYQVILRAAFDLLPPWAGDLLGVGRRPAPVRLAELASAGLLLSGLRLALGGPPPGERAALRRIAATGARNPVAPDATMDP